MDAAYAMGTLNGGSKFLNNRPPKAGEWWAGTQDPFRKGDRVMAFAARTAKPFPGDVPGGRVWTLGWGDPSGFGYYAGGVNDSFSGNAFIDNFGIFDNGGAFIRVVVART